MESHVKAIQFVLGQVEFRLQDLLAGTVAFVVGRRDQLQAIAVRDARTRLCFRCFRFDMGLCTMLLDVLAIRTKCGEVENFNQRQYTESHEQSQQASSVSCMQIIIIRRELRNVGDDMIK